MLSCVCLTVCFCLFVRLFSAPITPPRSQSPVALVNLATEDDTTGNTTCPKCRAFSGTDSSSHSCDTAAAAAKDNATTSHTDTLHKDNHKQESSFQTSQPEPANKSNGSLENKIKEEEDMDALYRKAIYGGQSVPSSDSAKPEANQNKTSDNADTASQNLEMTCSSIGDGDDL